MDNSFIIGVGGSQSNPLGFELDDKVQIFFTMARCNGRPFVSANEADTPEQAVDLLMESMSSEKKVTDIHVFAGLRFNWATRDLAIAEFDKKVPDSVAAGFQLNRRNPVQMASMVEYVREEYKNILTPAEKKTLKAVSKKLWKQMG